MRIQGIAFALALMPMVASAADLSCRVGPVERTYGGTKWLVYGCDDKASVVVVTAPGNPGMPFYFMFLHGSDGYHLHGEGTGDKKITDAAYRDLSELTESNIVALLAEVTHR
jgi:hypothetical protein